MRSLICLAALVGMLGCQSIPKDAKSIEMHTASETTLFPKNSLWSTTSGEPKSIVWNSGPYIDQVWTIEDPSVWQSIHQLMNDPDVQEDAMQNGIVLLGVTRDFGVEIEHSLVYRDRQLWWVWQPADIEQKVVYIELTQAETLLNDPVLNPTPTFYEQVSYPQVDWEQFDGETLEVIPDDPEAMFMLRTPAQALGLSEKGSHH